MNLDEFKELDARLSETKGTSARALIHSRTSVRYAADFIDKLLDKPKFTPLERQRLSALRNMSSDGLHLPSGNEANIEDAMAYLRNCIHITTSEIYRILADGFETLTYGEGRRLEEIIRKLHKAHVPEIVASLHPLVGNLEEGVG